MSEKEPVPEARTEEKRWLALDAKSEGDELSWLMSDKRGRRFIWRLLSNAGIYRLTYTGEALSSAFYEGQRNGGLQLNALLLKHCPDRYIEMQKEAQSYARRPQPNATRPARTSASARTNYTPG